MSMYRRRWLRKVLERSLVMAVGLCFDLAVLFTVMLLIVIVIASIICFSATLWMK